jgi:ferric-chelate reductase
MPYSVFLVGGWYHLAHFRKPTARWVDYYMWPGFLLWGLDRLVRAGRTFWNNTIWRKGDKKYSQGTVEVLSDDTLRLTLKRRITWTPGQHAYVILPSVSTIPTEAHPFTIASAPVSLDGSPNSKENNAVFIIRARGGFTSRLMALARKGPSSVPAFMDGPYGMPPDLSGFSTVVLVAGGSGVAYALPMLENLVRCVQILVHCDGQLTSCSLANKNKTTVQHIVLVWAIRRAGEHSSLFMVRCQVHVTKSWS